jgi:hypothetical protein
MIYNFGLVFTVVAGLTSPMTSVIMAEGLKVYDPKGTQEEINDAMKRLLIMIVVSAVILWTAAGLSFGLMQSASERLAFELRQKYLVSLLR